MWGRQPPRRRETNGAPCSLAGWHQGWQRRGFEACGKPQRELRSEDAVQGSWRPHRALLEDALQVANGVSRTSSVAFDDRTRACLLSMISECSWFSNGVRYCEPQDSPARPVLCMTLRVKKDQGNDTESGAADQRWRSTALVFNEEAFSSLCDCGKIGTLKVFLCPPPAPASSFRCYKGRLLTPGVQVWWRMRVLHTIWLSSWLMASEKEERSAHLVTLGTDVLQRTGSCQPHFLFLKFIVQCKVVIRMTSVRMCPIN